MVGEKTLNCPRCSSIFGIRPMRKIKHPSGAILDVCDKCNGMWLDGSEVSILYNQKNHKDIGRKAETAKRKEKNKGGKKWQR